MNHRDHDLNELPIDWMTAASDEILVNTTNLILIFGEIYKLAAHYEEALKDEFPQYECSLANLGRSWALLRVFDGDPRRIPILTAEFSSRCVNISYYGYVDDIPERHTAYIEYIDPKLTEDILSDILKTYDKRILMGYPIR